MSMPALPRAVLAFALAVVAGAAAAQPPPAGLAAEAAQRWEEAARVYREALAQHAEDAALWTRLGEVEARAGNVVAAAEAYERAAQLQPDQADAQREASRAWATAQQPAKALPWLERAIALQPRDDQLLIDRVRLANWLADYALAERTLDELLERDPDRTDLTADLGRVRAWQDRLDEADALFAEHLQRHPDDRLAWIDRARIAIWSGAYAKALDLLDHHDAAFPEVPDRAAEAERARALAWAGRWRAARALNAGSRADGESYDELFTQTVLERQHHRPVQALPWLERAQALKPGAEETLDLARGTWLPLRSRAGVEAAHFEDSEDIEIDTLGVYGAWRFGPASWLRLDLQQRRFDAPRPGSFASILAATELDEGRALIGFSHAPSENVEFDLRFGRSRVGDLDSIAIGTARLDWQASDDWSASLEAGRDRLAASPRSLSLGLHQRWFAAAFDWHPQARWRVQARAERGRVDDLQGNDRLVLDVAAWRALRRSRGWLWDAGVLAQWQDHEHAVLGRGYYAADDYRRVQLAARGYWRWNDDCGLALDAAAGVQRDAGEHGWKGATDVSAEAVFGIFSDFELRLRAAWSDRRQASGNFDGRSIGARLEYRF
jgi:tetratricopeptide (TPR) repeat protein